MNNKVVGFSSPSNTQLKREETIKKGNINQIVDRLDVLQLFETIGKTRAFSLYAILWFAFILINGAIILILVPVNDQIAQQNNQVLYAGNTWHLKNNRDMIQSNKLNLIVHNGKKLTKRVYESNHVTDNEQFDVSNLLLGFAEQDQENGIPITSTSFQFNLPISNTPKQFCLDFTIRNQKSDIQSNKYIEGVPKCSVSGGINMDRGITVNSIKKLKLSVESMIAQKICNQKEECKNLCKVNDGDYDGQTESCTALYSPEEICVVLNAQREDEGLKVKHWKYIGGCYNQGTDPFKLNFKGKVESIKLIARSSEDPVVQALAFSDSYQPIQIQTTKEQKISRILFTIGAITLLSLSAFVMVVQFYGINHQTECQPGKDNSNHLVRRQIGNTDTSEFKGLQISFDRSSI